MKTKAIIIDTISCLLILLFIYTSISKLTALTATYKAMNSQPFPNWMTPFLVFGIAILEIGISIGLMFDKTKLKSLFASFIMMLSFTVYIGLILGNVFARRPCGCGGVIKSLTWTQHLYFNIFFVIISLIAIILYDQNKVPSIKNVDFA